MHAKSKLIEKQIISNHSYNELFEFFDFQGHEKTKCHELLKTEVTGGHCPGYTKLTTPRAGKDKCWFITSGMIIGIQSHGEKEAVVLLFSAGEMAVLPDTFFNKQKPYCMLIACPDTHFIEISRDTIIKLQGLVSDPITIISKIACAPYKNYIERAKLTSMPGIEAILEFHKRHPVLKVSGKKNGLQNNYQASFLGMSDSTFCKLKKKIPLLKGKFPQISVRLIFFWEALTGTL